MDTVFKLIHNQTLTEEEKKEAYHYLSTQLVNTAEAAQLIDVSRITIENYVKKKQLIPVINRPNHKLYWKNDILALHPTIIANRKNPRGWPDS
ncbi:hypothetical protein [Listeria goaensis]|uniref:hypothetical protein n=1 Tax=Listeria goaensis TaxID=1649188 RepID=UPI000B587B57|nr:hypothetical protein [Listeria goaensis]